MILCNIIFIIYKFSIKNPSNKNDNIVNLKKPFGKIIDFVLKE